MGGSGAELVLKSTTCPRNTGEAPNADSQFHFWLGPDSPMTTPTSAAAPASWRYIIHAAASARQRSHRLFRLLDEAEQSAKHLRIAVGFVGGKEKRKEPGG